MRRRTPAQKLPDTETPAALLVGRCIEVWADPTEKPTTAGTVHTNAYYSARRRHGAARDGWLRMAGVTEVRDQCRLAPLGATWSVAWLLNSGREDQVTALLGRGGCSLDDLEALHEQADHLYREVGAR